MSRNIQESSLYTSSSLDVVRCMMLRCVDPNSMGISIAMTNAQPNALGGHKQLSVADDHTLHILPTPKQSNMS